MKKLQLILSKYNFQKRQTPLTLTPDEIEKLIGFKLPEDYIFFFKHYTGYENFIRNEFVRLWDMQDLIVSNLEYGIFGSQLSIIAIGGNDGGEFIGIKKTETNQLKIILSPFIDFENANHIIIGDSFTDFLERLDNGNKWFD